jgi:hypothetical protein
MKPRTVVFVLIAVLGVSVVLHLVQYGQVGVLEARVERFEKMTVKALAANLVALEKTLSHQQVLESLFLHSAELRLTFEHLENYNAKMKPRNYTNVKGNYDAQTAKLLREKPIQRRVPFGTGAWDEAFPLLAPAP